MLFARIGAGIAVGTALLLGASPALAAGWTIVPAPPTGQDAILASVTTTSDTDAWAAGYCCGRPNYLGTVPIIDHWNGTAWSQVTVPSTGYSTNGLYAVSASSTSDAWAVGRSEPQRYTFYPLGMHWNGTAWSVSTSFASALSGQIADGVADISPTDAYATGGGLGSAHSGLVAQWNGSTWTRLTVPQPKNNNLGSNLDAVSANGPNDVWIVGTDLFEVNSSDYSNETYSLHWNGSTWSIVPMPLNPGTNPNIGYALGAIQVNSPTDVWAVGEMYNFTNYSSSTLIEHYDGHSWTIVPSPSPGTNGSLSGVTTSNASSSVWAVGDYTNSSGQVQTLTLNWNGHTWNTVASPNGSTGSSVLASVATTPGAAIVQAVGYSGVYQALNPLAMQNG
ncbi:MAG TPA: hypothetical protein VIX86_08615 [Streptosporangiaceae bacterium]